MASSAFEMEAMDLEVARALCRRPAPPSPLTVERIPTEPIQLDHPNPETRTEFDCRLPDELLLRIIDVFVPKSGLCISNDADDDFYLHTVSSLLQTCHKIRREIFTRKLGSRLNIYITNGKRCRCQTLKKAKNIFKAPLGKALHLPFHLWDEVVIHFVPDVYRSARESCIMERQNMSRSLPKGKDLEARNMKCAMDCITRQSQALGEMMAGRAHIRRMQANINFKFVFDGTHGVDALNTLRELPLWTTLMMHDPLTGWEWTSATNDSLPPILVPRSITILLEMCPEILHIQWTRGESFKPLLTDAFELNYLRCWHALDRTAFWLRYQHRLHPDMWQILYNLRVDGDKSHHGQVPFAICLKEIMPTLT